MHHNLLWRAARSALLVAAAASLFAPLAWAQSAPAVATPAVSQFTLPNGLTVIVKPDRRAPTAVHMLWVRVGSMDEVDGTSGVAHVLEHMMFKGSRKLGPGEFSRRVAALGGQENAFTSYDYTGYYQQVPASRLAEVMALEADRFANNHWSDEEFAKELAVVKEERRMRTDDNPHALLGEQQNAVTFVASPYRRPVIGWMGDLDALTPDDARAFLRRWYTPANAALVVVGDVDPQAVRALAQRHYGGIAARALPARKPRPEPEQTGPRRLAVKAPAEQALVSLAFKVPRLSSLEPTPDNDDALALTVLSAVLDGYSGARLERALTQGPDRVADSAGASNGLMGRGPQLFSLTGVPAQGRSAAQVEAALRAQVARIAQDGVAEDELARVKTQWVASQVYKRDSVMGQAQELGHLWVLGLPLDSDERLIARLRQVSAAQVQAVARKYFGDDQMTAAVLIPQPRDPAAARPRTPPADQQR
jgi:zinc protease